MTRLVLVDRASDAPARAGGVEVVVLDAAWTPPSGGRPDLIPIRPLVQSIVDEVDVIDGSLDALDAWASAAGLAEAFTVDGVPWWNRARMLLRWDVHELVLWRLVLDRLTAAGRHHDSIVVPAGRLGLLAAARATSAAGGGSVEASGAEAGLTQALRGVRRRVGRLVQPLRSEPAAVAARRDALRRRLESLAREQGGLLVLAWPRAFQVVRDADRERRVDPYLVGALDRLAAGGERIVTIGLGLDPRRDEDWALAEADATLLPERFLVEHATTPGAPAIDSSAVREAVARAAAVRHPMAGVDLGPSLATLVAPYAGRWLDRQRAALRAATATLGELQPAAMFTDREGSRTAWLAAGRRAGVRSIAIQHGMIYPNNPEYFQGPGAGLVRPNVTCVFGDYERELLVERAGYAPDEVVVTGSPRPVRDREGGTEDREAVRRELGVRDGDRLLLVSVAHNEVLGELHTFGLLERTLAGPLPGIHVVIKLHPQDRAEPRHEVLLRGLADARGYQAPLVSVVRDVDLYRLLHAADAHLGQYSTVLSDAVVTGTPNMIAVGHAHADALDYVAAGVATPVQSVEQVRAFVARPHPTNPAARQRFLDAHYRSGDAAGRLADVLRATLGGSTSGAESGAPSGPVTDPPDATDARGSTFGATIAPG